MQSKTSNEPANRYWNEVRVNSNKTAEKAVENVMEKAVEDVTEI